tara:strand:+ start:215867 stop:217147 length:1281 start_codon:yes stop_codon:yes gene_type:complete
LNWLGETWPWLLSMGVLILFSAFFSGSEAALFSLTPRGRRQIARGGVGGRVATGLLQDPERLLSAVLFWNLLINMIYFAIAAIIGGRLESDPERGSSPAIAFTFASLLTIIFFSEMLPKSFAVLAPVRISVLVGAPLAIAVRIVSPVLPLVKVTNLAAGRLIWPTFEPEPTIELADIERAIELGTDDAALLHRERMALRGLVEMAETRVGEVMRPRAKLLLCPAPGDRAVLAAGTPPGGYLMLTDAEGRNITSTIGIRMLRPSLMDDFAAAAEPVIYAPWSARVSQVLDQLNEENVSVAVVVNEFGESIGALSIEDILRRVLAPRMGEEESSQAEEIQVLGNDCYRVLGSLSLRVLAKRLDVELPDESIATVAGYIQRINERLPRTGDSASFHHYELVVTDQVDDETWIDVRPESTTPESSPEDGG